MEKQVIALALLLMYDTYMRPGEACGLRVRDLVLPLPGRRGHQRPAVIIAAEDTGRLTKVRERDDTVTVDDQDIALSPHLLALARGKAADEPLLGVPTKELKEGLEEAAARLGLSQEHLCSYQCRHGGASRDALF